MVLASKVLPDPGGPYSRIPSGTWDNAPEIRYRPGNSGTVEAYELARHCKRENNIEQVS